MTEQARPVLTVDGAQQARTITRNCAPACQRLITAAPEGRTPFVAAAYFLSPAVAALLQ